MFKLLKSLFSQDPKPASKQKGIAIPKTTVVKSNQPKQPPVTNERRYKNGSEKTAQQKTARRMQGFRDTHQTGARPVAMFGKS